jgi:DNA-binding MarR family transcriptional regulator
MSWQSLADVFEYVQRQADLSSADVLVLLALANFENANEGYSYPSLKALTTVTKLARRTLQYTLQRLEARRILRITRHTGRRHTPHYTLCLPKGIAVPQREKKGATIAPGTFL